MAATAAVTALLAAAPTAAGILDAPFGAGTDSGASAASVGCGGYQPSTPSGGIERPVTNQEELVAALAAAGPGDTINLATGTYSRIDYRRDHGHRPGTPTAPVVIQAAAGSKPVVDAGDDGKPSRRLAVSIDGMSHVQVRGIEIRNGIFGALSRGSSAITFEHNHIHRLGQVGVVSQAAQRSSGLEPSSATVIRCNSIHHTGMLDPEFGEGIYAGTGGTGAVDRTSGVLIEGNEIYSIANEAIDVKRYTTDVTIRHNLIHDITPYYGGAVSLGLNKNNWGPANYVVENNRIWNVSSGRDYAQAVAIGHGPTTIRNNVIWGVETRTTGTWPWTATIQVHGNDSTDDSAYGFGNPAASDVVITGNTVVGCSQGCIDSYTEPGQIKPNLTVHSNVVDQASTGDATNGADIVITAADLIGPTTGIADSGSGPGSGLRLRDITPSSTSAPTTPTTTARSTSAPEAPPSSNQPATRPRAGDRPQPVPTIGTTGASGSADRDSKSVPTRPDDGGSRAATTAPPEPSTSRTRAATKTTPPSPTAPGDPPTSETSNTRVRGPSERRLFFDLNLWDWQPSPTAAAALPAEPGEQDARSRATTPGRREVAAESTETTVDRREDPSKRRRNDGHELPSTTRPDSTAGLTIAND